MYVEGGCPKSRRESLVGGEEAGGGGRETSIYGCDVSGGRAQGGKQREACVIRVGGIRADRGGGRDHGVGQKGGCDAR